LTKHKCFSDAVSGGDTGKDLDRVICRHRKCRERFIPKRLDQVFCSPECRKAFWEEVRQEGLKIVGIVKE